LIDAKGKFYSTASLYTLLTEREMKKVKSKKRGRKYSKALSSNNLIYPCSPKAIAMSLGTNKMLGAS
jgi:hypothetical protein